LRATHRLSSFLLAFILIELFAAPARGELYQWVDEAGRLHVTDDLSSVPERHRPGARWEASEDFRRATSRWNTVDIAPPTSMRMPAAGHRGASSASKTGSTHVLRVQKAGREIRVGALLNDRVVAPCIVDTGATLNTLPRAYVERLGIHIDEDTPRTILSGVGGRPFEAPLVRIRSIRIGTAVVRNVEVAVLDTMPVGLLGTPFVNHFRVSLDPTQGTLTLQEIDLEAIEGIHGGYDEGTWRAKFGQVRYRLEQIRERRADTPRELIANHAEMDAEEAYWRKRLEELEIEATRAGVPRSWRE